MASKWGRRRVRAARLRTATHQLLSRTSSVIRCGRSTGTLRLDSGSEAVRKALGADVWELVREDRIPPTDRLAPGLGIGSIREVVEQLESL